MLKRKKRNFEEGRRISEKNVDVNLFQVAVQKCNSAAELSLRIQTRNG